jgi:predicted phosphodiesterase
MRVSIIVPVLDEAVTIGTTLRGLRDDFPGCELLVVDGGSTDGTPAAAAPLAHVLTSTSGAGAADERRRRGGLPGTVPCGWSLSCSISGCAISSAPTRSGFAAVTRPGRADTPGRGERAMRIGLCGGPYANPYALRAFVADARERGCERLFCLGDLGGFGAEMEPLWPILTRTGVQCIAGNYDVALARGDVDCGCGYTDDRDNASAQRIYDHTRAATSRDFAAWMHTLPRQHRERIGGCELHLVHGSPLALNDFWWESLPAEAHRLRVAESGADVICCTHSGLPWQARVGEALVVNVGVIGKPANDGRAETWYAILDLAGGQARAELVALSYDHGAQAASMRAAGMAEELAETIETGYWTTCIEILPPARPMAPSPPRTSAPSDPATGVPVDPRWRPGRAGERRVREWVA